MKKSYDSLPEHYTEIYKIDLKEDKGKMVFLNIGTLVLIVPFIIPMFFFKYTFTLLEPFDSLPVLFGILVALILVMVVHELIHGIFFKIFAKGKLQFKFHGFAASCSMPTHYFAKAPYIIIGLAPAVIITIVTGILSVVLYNTNLFLVFYIAMAVNFSGCIGDFYVFFKILKMKKTVLVNDYGIGMHFFDIESKFYR